MTPPRLLFIGECMIEFAREEDGRWRQGFAGDVLNAAWAARALLPGEAARVSFFSRIGADAFSGAMAAHLESGGVDTGLIARDPDRQPGLYTIETDPDGERRFTYWRGQSAARALADDPAALRDAVAGARLIYLSGITMAILPETGREALLEALGAREAGSLLAYDPNVRPRLWEAAAAMRAVTERLAGMSDVALPTFDDERLAFGDAGPADTLARYRSLGCPEVVVKDGPAPTLFDGPDGRGEAAEPGPARAVDTTGAGDAFNGAYLARRFLGAPQGEAVRAARAVAARIVTRRGALLPPEEYEAAMNAPRSD